METTGRFLHQVLDTMQNWRDTMQAGLPGYHDRVAPVALAAGEGGLNLQMGPEAIADLMARGATAGEQLLREFDWDRHRFLRYLTLMQLLETDLHAASPAFAVWGPELARGVPASARDFLSGHDEAWCRAAAAATQGLFDVAAAWGAEPAPALGFGARRRAPPDAGDEGRAAGVSRAAPVGLRAAGVAGAAAGRAGKAPPAAVPPEWTAAVAATAVDPAPPPPRRRRGDRRPPQRDRRGVSAAKPFASCRCRQGRRHRLRPLSRHRRPAASAG